MSADCMAKTKDFDKICRIPIKTRELWQMFLLEVGHSWNITRICESLPSEMMTKITGGLCGK